jgi:excisionase family DNA binding protein
MVILQDDIEVERKGSGSHSERRYWATDEAAETSEWLTAAEAAAYFKVKSRSLLLWVRQGKIQAYALTGTQRRVWRFRKEDLDATLLSRPVVSSDAPAVLTERVIS